MYAFRRRFYPKWLIYSLQGENTFSMTWPERGHNVNEQRLGSNPWPPVERQPVLAIDTELLLVVEDRVNDLGITSSSSLSKHTAAESALWSTWQQKQTLTKKLLHYNLEGYIGVQQTVVLGILFVLMVKHKHSLDKLDFIPISTKSTLRSTDVRLQCHQLLENHVDSMF